MLNRCVTRDRGTGVAQATAFDTSVRGLALALLLINSTEGAQT